MPRLLLFRHAKAEATQPGSTDHARALTKSGRRDAEAMGEVIANRAKIDLVLCSDARRAKETWEAASAAFDPQPEARLTRALYDASDYLPILNAEGGDAKAVLVVGHNPTMHETALALSSSLSGADGAILASRFPKAAVAVFDFDGSWASLAKGRARLAAFMLPER